MGFGGVYIHHISSGYLLYTESPAKGLDKVDHAPRGTEREEGEGGMKVRWMPR